MGPFPPGLFFASAFPAFAVMAFSPALRVIVLQNLTLLSFVKRLLLKNESFEEVNRSLGNEAPSEPVWPRWLMTLRSRVWFDWARLQPQTRTMATLSHAREGTGGAVPVYQEVCPPEW